MRLQLQSWASALIRGFARICVCARVSKRGQEGGDVRTMEPCNEAPMMAAPTATALSGLTTAANISCTLLPKYSESRCCSSGMLLEPPTMITRSTDACHKKSKVSSSRYTYTPTMQVLCCAAECNQHTHSQERSERTQLRNLSRHSSIGMLSVLKTCRTYVRAFMHSILFKQGNTSLWAFTLRSIHHVHQNKSWHCIIYVPSHKE